MAGGQPGAGRTRRRPFLTPAPLGAGGSCLLLPAAAGASERASESQPPLGQYTMLSVALPPPLLSPLLLSGACCVATAAAQLSFGDAFKGGAVLQRGADPVTVWGRAEPGAQLSVAIDGVVVAHARASDEPNGIWAAVLPAHPAASFDSTLTAYSGGDAVSVAVMWGEVLLCGGQSNMGLAVGTGPFLSGPDAPKYGFHADNVRALPCCFRYHRGAAAASDGPICTLQGTAESAAAGRYTGKIMLKAMSGRPTQRPGVTLKNGTDWFSTTPTSLPYFSAICWYVRCSFTQALALCKRP
eukprot:COSAG01_NODE_1195_length_11304_cov_118.555823_14_plen_298_part_00